MISSFFEKIYDIYLYWVDLTYDFVQVVYGSAYTGMSEGNILFIMALLPTVLGFAVEVFLTFLLSFRARRFRIFVPFKTSIRELKRPESYVFHSRPLFSFSKRENLKFTKPAFYSFSDRSLTSAKSFSIHDPGQHKFVLAVSDARHHSINSTISDDIKYHRFTDRFLNLKPVVFISHSWHNLRFKYRGLVLRIKERRSSNGKSR